MFDFKNWFSKKDEKKIYKENISREEFLSLLVYSLLFGIFGPHFIRFTKQFAKKIEFYAIGEYQFTEGEVLLFLGMMAGVVMFSKILFKSKYGFWIFLIFTILGTLSNNFLLKI